MQLDMRILTLTLVAALTLNLVAVENCEAGKLERGHRTLKQPKKGTGECKLCASLSLGILVQLGSLSKEGEKTGGLLIKKPTIQTEPSKKGKHLITNQETNKGGKPITTNECVNTVEVMCKSCQGRYAECPVFAAKKILKADPVHIFDNSPCIEGQTWGVMRERVVWVDGNCVAKFKICFENFEGKNAVNYDDVECQGDGSNNKSYCKVGRSIAQVEVLMRFDTKRCVRDKTFGFEGTHVWVSKGCWAKFRVYF